MWQRDRRPAEPEDKPPEAPPPRVASAGCAGVILLVVVAAGVVGGRLGIGSSPSVPDTAAQAAAMLAGQDAAAGHPHPPSAYTAVLTELTRRCTQADPVVIAQMTDGTAEDLAQRGVQLDRFSVLEGVAGSLPAGAARVDCAARFQAYETDTPAA